MGVEENGLRRAREAGRLSTSENDAEELRSHVAWFLERDILLGFQQLSDGSWNAVMLPASARVGAADHAAGQSKLDAASAARAKFSTRPEALREASAEIGVRIDGDSAPASTSHVVSLTDEGLAISDEITVAKTPAPHSPLDSAEFALTVERLMTDYGWYVGFTDEPDGSFSWFAVDPVSNEVLRSGTSDDWDSAKLDVIESLQPPSDEGRSDQ
jgi:hypothetical protein